jgi:EAL domain-containing protein (putative c-di-GMP-specific phosphodiesterase class I)/CHASE2 domain-containing sensor protein
MRDVDATHQEPTQPRPWRTLFWIAVAGLIFGILGLGEIGEDVLRSGRNSLHWHKASGDIVVVKIDNDSLKQVGRWPWPRHIYPQILDQLNKAGAKRVFFDIQFYGPTNAADDDAFAAALARTPRPVLALGREGSPNGVPGETIDVPPLPKLAQHAQTGAIFWTYNYQNSITRIPYAVTVKGRSVPSFAALLSGRSGTPDSTFMPDYSIDPHSIPTMSAVSVLNGSFDPATVRGKDVVIGTSSVVIGDMYFVPGTGLISGAVVHVIGAETLKSGMPIDAGWLPLYLASLLLGVLLLMGRIERRQGSILAAALLAVLIGPAALEDRLIYVDVTPALFVLVASSVVLIRRRFNKRGLVDPMSGLPNLAALKASRGAREKALIVARILNYAEIVAALPTTSERQLVEQIVARLTVGDRGRTLFQGDDGIFAWFDDPGKPFGHHLEALHALFRTPVRVGGMAIDLSVSFGVEIGSARSVANRLGSALLAAEQAGHDGLKWKYHDPDSLQDASWKLSMLSQLDEAVDRGEVWVAYQPKIDLKTRGIIGAEALARWTHPEKGPIAAAEFVAAAEQNDRIGKLTAFVLDRAIAAAAALNKPGNEFDMSVNLSGRLLGDKALVGRIAILLERHGLAAKNLTLELTETAAIAGSGEALDLLTQLRELGVNISIDDYGTGLSTLEYLKRVPAGEIKIDQSFIKGMMDNRSERLMVSSTIALAHSLGRRIVAEGVETREALELLAEMECDIAQGFITGRPMSLESLRRRLMTERRAKVA